MIDVAPRIGERTKLSEKLKKEIRNLGNEAWMVCMGNYDNFYSDEHNFSERKDQNELRSVEKILTQQIKELVNFKTDQPVIVLDFGGMYSLSFLRMAENSEIRGLVESEKVILVVTNLGFTLEEGLKTVDRDKYISQDQLELINKNKNLVAYIQSDAAELRNKKIISHSTGRKIDLNGHIDLVHESMALAHGLKNDVDLYLLAKCLSSNGIMFIGSTYSHPEEIVPPGFRPFRDEAHSIGFSNLEKAGMVEVIPKKTSNYRIFSMPNAPTIVL